jgi:hypothetical protein
VLLGSPVQGSQAARNLSRGSVGNWFIGRTAREALVSPPARRWTFGRELGVISGTRDVGLGRIVGIGGAPSDGTVFVEETRIEGSKQHLLLPVSHTGMEFSPKVAAQAAHFLREGRFKQIGTQDPAPSV